MLGLVYCKLRQENVEKDKLNNLFRVVRNKFNKIKLVFNVKVNLGWLGLQNKGITILNVQEFCLNVY